MSIDEIQQMLYSETFVACNEIAVKIVGLSMAEWNFFLNFMLIFFLLIIYFYNKFEKIYLEISNDSTNNQS
jgi:disulfide bond formation protein DsbB